MNKFFCTFPDSHTATTARPFGPRRKCMSHDQRFDPVDRQRETTDVKTVLVAISILLVVLGAGLWLIKYPSRGSSNATQSPALKEGVQEASAEAILDHIKDLNAPLVLVNFWASWCEPCKQEFPYLLELRRKYAPQGLKLVLISLDEPGDLSAAESFLRDQKVNFPSFYKGSQSLQFVTQIFPGWSGAVPATLLFGPDLKILDAWEGDTSLEEFESRVQPHLKGT
ncbi:MAG: redoxin domain-containing protein [Bdellovibrionales bacterium]